VSAVRVVIKGRVQGVGFRAWVIREARQRKLTGWVGNRNDGSVEALFAGDAATVDAMLEACRTGPRLAAVRDITASPADDEGWGDFSARPDA